MSLFGFRPSVTTASLAAFCLLACSSPVDPESTVTLLVTNQTCQPGPCVPLEIRGFAPKFTVPGQPPAGLVVIGWVDGPSACLRFPLQHSITVSGGGQLTQITWTINDPISVTANDRDPLSVVGTTEAFVPAAALGWSVTFPAGQGTAEVTAADPCVR